MYKTQNFVLASLLALAVASPAIAETATTGSDAVQPKAPEATQTTPRAMTAPAGTASITVQHDNQVLSSDLVGRPVVNSEGQNIGEISNLIIDDQDRVVGAVVSVGGFLGLGSKEVGVAWNEIRLSREDDKLIAMVDMSEQSLTAAPEFKSLAEAERDRAAAAAQAERARQLEQQTKGQLPGAAAE
ncbi:PRC-barrel domain-containing protein [Oceanibacterium hippocampi]|uniref:PRC-barrel domain protein n=1 Tax=Oceanibacterium hippocampi TaxID=745714 RepID=A0A1Y5T0A7_9PROT|nr:PRC-barrel domain-containing protein [Oceanibacterium hippocampi]SLN49090.1 PRC-barrel domain protein [Oceanibacterium hippocampi]